jgi:hypothetical protein
VHVAADGAQEPAARRPLQRLHARRVVTANRGLKGVYGCKSWILAPPADFSEGVHVGRRPQHDFGVFSHLTAGSDVGRRVAGDAGDLRGERCECEV